MPYPLPFFVSVLHLAFANDYGSTTKALNSFVDYANHSADEVAKVVKGIISYYPKIHQKRTLGTRDNVDLKLVGEVKAKMDR